MARRDAVLRAMKDHPISQRRACVLIGVDPKTVRRERPPDNPEIREEMHKIAESGAGSAIGASVSCWSARAW
jgi:putative transposase